MMNDRFLRSYLPAFLIGGLVGAVVMALFTPYTGREMRDRIASKSQEVKDQVVSKVQDTSHRTGKVVGEFTQQAKDTAGNIFRRGRLTAEEYKSNIEEEAKSKSVQFGS